MSKKEYPAKLTNDYYRVREVWEDEASQLGAYRLLANAKAKCDENGLLPQVPVLKIRQKPVRVRKGKTKHETISEIGDTSACRPEECSKGR